MNMSVRFLPVNQAFALERAEVALAETSAMPMVDIMVSTSSTTLGSSKTHSCEADTRQRHTKGGKGYGTITFCASSGLAKRSRGDEHKIPSRREVNPG